MLKGFYFGFLCEAGFFKVKIVEFIGTYFTGVSKKKEIVLHLTGVGAGRGRSRMGRGGGGVGVGRRGVGVSSSV